MSGSDHDDMMTEQAREAPQVNHPNMNTLKLRHAAYTEAVKEFDEAERRLREAREALVKTKRAFGASVMPLDAKPGTQVTIPVDKGWITVTYGGPPGEYEIKWTDGDHVPPAPAED